MTFAMFFFSVKMKVAAVFLIAILVVAVLATDGKNLLDHV